MDDTAQNNNQNPTSQIQNPNGDVQQQVPPVAQAVVQPNQQQQPVQAPASVHPKGTSYTVAAPVGKETAPTSTSNVTEANAAAVTIEKPAVQVVQETAPEATVSTELQEVGVEPTKGEVLQMPPEVADVGVTPMGTAVPIPVEPTITLPLTAAQATQTLKKHGKWKLSVAWMAMLVIRQLQIVEFHKKKEKKV